ncbi:MAG: winged helix-turn-helix domain-containing protein [Gemmatimonadota bacterium]
MADRAGHTKRRTDGTDERVRPVGGLRAIGGLAKGEGPLGLDQLIHGRLRLGMVSALAVEERLSFNDLKRLLKTTDGNLSAHARKLEEAGYIVQEKSFQERVPHTEFRLTPEGRTALERYLGHMESLIRTARHRE